jgi:hypothetical protein
VDGVAVNPMATVVVGVFGVSITCAAHIETGARMDVGVTFILHNGVAVFVSDDAPPVPRVTRVLGVIGAGVIGTISIRSTIRADRCLSDKLDKGLVDPVDGLTTYFEENFFVHKLPSMIINQVNDAREVPHDLAVRALAPPELAAGPGHFRMFLGDLFRRIKVL